MAVPELPVNLDELMPTRGIIYKMLLDSREHRTAEELDELGHFLEWLHTFVDAKGEGHQTVLVHLR